MSVTLKALVLAVNDNHVYLYIPLIRMKQCNPNSLIARKVVAHGHLFPLP
jgi:hypothetical protein